MTLNKRFLWTVKNNRPLEIVRIHQGVYWGVFFDCSIFEKIATEYSHFGLTMTLRHRSILVTGRGMLCQRSLCLYSL